MALLRGDFGRRGHGHAPCFGENGIPHRVIQIAFTMGKLLLQMRARKLEGDKLVPLVGLPRRNQGLVAQGIIA